MRDFVGVLRAMVAGLLMGSSACVAEPAAGALSAGGGSSGGAESSGEGTSSGAEGTTGGADGMTSGEGTSRGEASVGGSGASEGADLGEVLFDLGGPESGFGPPLGCATKKIDVLITMTTAYFITPQYYEWIRGALQELVAALRLKIPGVDLQIMVVDVDGYWGTAFCSGDLCPPDGGCAAIDEPTYPCWALHTPGALGMCDHTPGAGVTFPAGKMAANYRCELTGGRRYITKYQASVSAALDCVSDVGIAGGNAAGIETALMALDPAMNGPGGCNYGFSRPDALLLTVFASPIDADGSDYNPYVWVEQLREAKGDADALLIFVISRTEEEWGKCLLPESLALAPLSEMTLWHEHAVHLDLCAPSYQAYYDALIGKIGAICAAKPQG